MKKFGFMFYCILCLFASSIFNQSALASENSMELSNGPFIDKEKKFTFYDAQSNRWYHTKLKKNVKRHAYDWTKLVHKKNRIKYNDRNFTVRQGIDVYYRNGNIDWKQVKKSGIDFAFIRIGYRGYGQRGSLQIDKRFYQNIHNAHRAGLDVGVYLFSQAINQAEALQEANLVLKTLHGTKLELPVVYDPEKIPWAKARTDGISRKQFTRNSLTFCKKIEKAGYDAMIYSNMYSMAYRFDMKKLEKYPFWYADYRKKPQTPYLFSFWQYSAKGRVAGVPTKVDLNIQFIPKNNKPKKEDG